MKLTEDELKEFAGHLRCPDGEGGIKVAQMMNVSNANIIRKTISGIAIGKDDKILEIGPGNGNHVKDLLLSKNVKYYGIDISETMVAEASKMYHGIKNVSFQLSDGENLSFSSGYFQKAFTVNTIYFWKDANAYAREIARVLEENAEISIGFIPKRVMQKIPFSKYGFTMYAEADVRILLENSGFAVLSEITEKEFIAGSNGEQIEREFVVTSAKKITKGV